MDFDIDQRCVALKVVITNHLLRSLTKYYPGIRTLRKKHSVLKAIRPLLINLLLRDCHADLDLNHKIAHLTQKLHWLSDGGGGIVLFPGLDLGYRKRADIDPDLLFVGVREEHTGKLKRFKAMNSVAVTCNHNCHYMSERGHR